MSSRIPTVVLDLDDCLLDFTGGLLHIVNQIHGTHLCDNDMLDWEFSCTNYIDKCGNKVTGKDIKNTMIRFENKGLYAGLDPLPFAVQALYDLKNFGYKIVLLTARPDKFGEETYFNLTKHNMPFNQLIFNWDKVKIINELSQTHEIFLFADDKLDTIKSVAEKCEVENVCLIDKVHNRKRNLSEKIIRVRSVFEAIRYLKNLNKDK